MSIAILVNLNGVFKKQVSSSAYYTFLVNKSEALVGYARSLNFPLCGQRKTDCVTRNKLLAN